MHSINYLCLLWADKKNQRMSNETTIRHTDRFYLALELHWANTINGRSLCKVLFLIMIDTHIVSEPYWKYQCCIALYWSQYCGGCKHPLTTHVKHIIYILAELICYLIWLRLVLTDHGWSLFELRTFRWRYM